MRMHRVSFRCHLIALMIALIFSFTGCHSIQSRPNRGDGVGGLLGLRKQKDGQFDEELLTSVDPLGARGYNRLLLDDLSPGNLSTTLAVRTTYKEDRPAAEAAYEKGQQLYNQALAMLDANPDGTDHIDSFKQAANEFRLAAGKFPDSQLEHDALYFEGEAFFFANHYVQANRAFENLITRYSGSRYLDKAEARRFSIAEYWLKLADDGAKVAFNDPSRPRSGLATEAQRIFHRIRLDDPTGKLADDATLALANAYFKTEKWIDAAETYEDLRRNYPGSPHQFHAHMFELKSRLNSYQGKSYDQDPLVKSDKLLKQIMRQFPLQAREEETYLAQEAGTIRHLLAEREWGMAKYFENQGENLAAKHYYNQVAENFGDTEFGKQVSGEIERVAELPDKPKEHAKWLVDMFPDTEKAKPVIASNPTSLLR